MSWITYRDTSGIKNSPVQGWLCEGIMSGLDWNTDGSKFVTTTGFEYTVKEVRGKDYREVMDGFLEMGLWSPALKCKA